MAIKKYWRFVVVVVSFLLVSTPLLAEEETEEQLESNAARWSLVKKTGGLLGGLGTGYLCHAAGHQLMASVEGVDMSWRFKGVNLSWSANTNSKTKLRDIALGGFGAQVVSTEIMLATDKIPKDNAFVLGWLGFNIFNSVRYVLSNEWSSGHGDLATLRNTGMDVRWLEAGLVAHAVLSGYRIYKDPKFIPYIRVTRQELGVAIGWQW